ncbi:MAG TPA: hypothetical protein ACFE0H_15280 [Elainellaceae cyanobacterium]
MTAAPQSLKVLVRPCDSGMCPALYADETGRIFVQGKRLNQKESSGLTIPDHEAVVEIPPELIAFLKSN